MRDSLCWKPVQMMVTKTEHNNGQWIESPQKWHLHSTPPCRLFKIPICNHTINSQLNQKQPKQDQIDLDLYARLCWWWWKEIANSLYWYDAFFFIVLVKKTPRVNIIRAIWSGKVTGLGWSSSLQEFWEICPPSTLFQNVGWQVCHLKCYRWQMNIALQEKLEQKGPLWISQQSKSRASCVRTVYPIKQGTLKKY